MAAILITVTNDLYTITLDHWDWTGLTVNGTPISGNNQQGWTYTQTTPGPIDFTATANYVTTVNPGNHFLMKGAGNDHLCDLVYSDPGSDFTLYGLLLNVASRPHAEVGPFSFSQGKMTGVYRHG